MAEKKTPFWRVFPRPFWIANAMEIFERMAWYGFYAVSSLYLTADVSEGGLGLTSGDRGVIQGLVTFFLYLFPAVFGTLADRYGFKRMFLLSVVVMVPSYLLLQLPTTFWSFFGIAMVVAVGHGMFKPVVISTVAKTTTAETGSMGFGIFYMMVNIGGFVGPIVAGIVRGWDWKYIFYASAGWILVMGVVCLIFYREPRVEGESKRTQPLGEVFRGMIALVGNLRFFLLISGLLVVLVLGAKWWDFKTAAAVAIGWLAVNLIHDLYLRHVYRGTGATSWLLQPLKIGEGRYLVFLLLMSAFWISFNQIFMTLPEYIRDYVDTRDLVDAFGLGAVWLDKGQVKPEYLINLNAFGIICGQVLVSYLSRNLKPLTSLILGVAVTAVSLAIFPVGLSGLVVVIALLVFSVGEMLASPRSKDYAARIAPPEKAGMYMGYFYWCVALGNLFGGLLSGVMYEHFGPTHRGGVDDPDTMWLFFAVLAAVSVVALWMFDRWVKRHPAK